MIKKVVLGCIISLLVGMGATSVDAISMQGIAEHNYTILEEDKIIIALPKIEVSDFLKHFDDAEGYKVYKSNGKDIVTDGFVGTEMIYKNGSGEAYTIVVIGDTNGDGTVTLDDIDSLEEYLVHKVEKITDKIFVKANDLNFDGKVDQIDLTLTIRLMINGVSVQIPEEPQIPETPEEPEKPEIPEEPEIEEPEIPEEPEVEEPEIPEEPEIEEPEGSDYPPIILRKSTVDGDEYEVDTWINEDVYIGINPEYDNKNVVVSYEVIGANKIDKGTVKGSTLKKSGVSEVIVSETYKNKKVVTSKYYIKIDKEAPEPPIIEVFENKARGWYTHPVVARISKLEDGDLFSGIKNITYFLVVNGVQQEEKEIESLETIQLEEDNKYEIIAYSYDKVGNKSEPAKAEILIDTVAPIDSKIQVVEGKLGKDNWYVSDVALQFISGIDITSTIKNMTYEINADITKAGKVNENNVEVGKYTLTETEIDARQNLKLTAEGEYNIKLNVYDYAGNKTEVEKNIKIDKKNDSKLTNKVTGVLGEHDWYISNIGIEINTSKDITSGVQMITQEFLEGLNGEEFEVQPKDTTVVSEDGVTSVVYRTYDNAGNIHTALREYRKDSSAPENITITCKEQNSTGFVVEVSAEDEHSGIYEYSLYVDDKLCNKIRTDDKEIRFVVEDQTTDVHNIYAEVVNYAGLKANSEVIQTEPVRLSIEDIKYVEFVVDKFELSSNEEIVNNNGALYFISDTSISEESKYIQISGKENDTVGVLKGHTRIVKYNDEVIENLEFYPESLTIDATHYSSGYGEDWSHLTRGELYDVPLYVEGEEEGIVRKTSIGILDKTTNRFDISEQKYDGIETYTRIIINSIKCDGKAIKFRIVE